ncbi:hypothetical protein [Thalassobacillus pellis]|uniref:hypothetical protein n=1 Tax=Thalassobacillus pellis TaxID=748008 RepID=UPI0019617EA3|nr:hypothetical protein [Thalassobacillus pellis]MBM7554787.1 hypothetical protein [Thalassobacillus pellis]
MLTYEIMRSDLLRIKPMDEDLVTEEIEKVISEYNLTISQKTTLSTKKGSVHWHLKKSLEKGVLEVTYWPKEARLWINIASNRRASWNLEMIEPLAKSFTKKIGGEVEQVR